MEGYLNFLEVLFIRMESDTNFLGAPSMMMDSYSNVLRALSIKMESTPNFSEVASMLPGGSHDFFLAPLAVSGTDRMVDDHRYSRSDDTR